jgi:GNAT superfamily N-acetyltransferase
VVPVLPAADGRAGDAAGVVGPVQRARDHDQRGTGGALVTGPEAGLRVRPATYDDWSVIWPFFRRIVADGETYAFPEDLTEETGRSWWMEQPPGRTFVAVDAEGTVLGSAKSGPNRPGRGSHVSTASFMVHPDHGGRGVGRLLAEHVLRWATEQGYASMQFNAVVETNTRAVALWRSLGFEVIGTVPEAFDSATHGRVGLHVMWRRLTPP